MKINNKKVIWLIIDGLPYWIIEYFISRDFNLPIFKNLYNNNKIIRLKSVRPNCQTPPSLASLFLGIPPSDHEIFGFDIPNKLNTIDPTDMISAFSIFPSGGNLIWEKYIDIDKKVRLIHIPFVKDHKKISALNCSSYGYNTKISNNLIIKLDKLPVKLFNKKYKKYMIEKRNKDIYWIEKDKISNKINHELKLNLGNWNSVVIDNIPSIIGLHNIEGSIHCIFLGFNKVIFKGSKKEECENIFKNVPFISNGLVKEYRQGKLGKSLLLGGNGNSEILLADSLIILANRFQSEFEHAIKSNDSDLIISYQPILDLLLHEIIGFLNIEHTKLLAEKIIYKCLLFIEESLNILIKANNNNSKIIVCSDHGMRCVSTNIYVNNILYNMKYLKLHFNKKIDFVNSMCFFHPSEVGFICFNLKKISDENTSIDFILDEIKKYIFNNCSIEINYKKYYNILSSEFNWLDSSYFLIPENGAVFKSFNDNSCIIKKSLKTGDHSINNDDPQLDGIFIDLSNNKIPDNQINVQQVLNFIYN